MSKVASVEATVIHTDDIAMWRPGQILNHEMNVRPREEVNLVDRPSPEAKRGLRVSDIRVGLSVEQEAFRFKGERIGIHHLEKCVNSQCC